jgi:hypothetical protein
MIHHAGRWLVAAALLVAATLAAAAAPGRGNAATRPPIALGVSVGNPDAPSDLSSYAAAVGRNPAIVMWFQSFDEPLFYPGQLAAVRARGAVPMITWEPAHTGGAGIPLRDIADGRDDAYLRHAAVAAAAWEKPLFVRFAHEMNLDSSPWGPGVDGNTAAVYVSAWRHVVALFRRAGATNVRWVWSPNVDCGGKCPFASFYPGDAWVDWVALDGYNYSTVADLPWMSATAIFESSYRALGALTSKPVMIAETASAESGGDKAAWIRQSLLSDVPSRMPRVRAVIWFQQVLETDWRFDSSPASLAAFRTVAASPLYSGTGAGLVAATQARKDAPGRSGRATGQHSQPWPVPLPPWFWIWARWRENGALPSARPPGIPDQLPHWSWARLRRL